MDKYIRDAEAELVALDVSLTAHFNLPEFSEQVLTACASSTRTSTKEMYAATMKLLEADLNNNPELYGFPKEGCDLESLGGYIKDVGNAAWKTIATLLEKIKKQSMALYNYVVKLFTSKNADVEKDMEIVVDTISNADKAVEGAGLVEGDVPPEDLLEAIEISGGTIYLDDKGGVVTSKSIHRDVTMFMKERDLKHPETISLLTMNSKVSPPEELLKDTLGICEVLAAYNPPSEIDDLAKAIFSVTNYDDIRAILDGADTFNARAQQHMISALKLEKGSKGGYVSKEMLGGARLKVVFKHSGSFVFPMISQTTAIRTKQVAQRIPSMTMAQFDSWRGSLTSATVLIGNAGQQDVNGLERATNIIGTNGVHGKRVTEIANREMMPRTKSDIEEFKLLTKNFYKFYVNWHGTPKHTARYLKGISGSYDVLVQWIITSLKPKIKHGKKK